MMATKRITRKQLRSIVERQLREAVMIDDQGDTENAVRALTEHIAEAWMRAYDEGDPSQAPLGQDAWDEQVYEATEDLATRIFEAIDKVDKKLLEGEYYHDTEQF